MNLFLRLLILIFLPLYFRCSPSNVDIIIRSFSEPTKERPNYTIDLHIHHRRTPVSRTWKNIPNNAQVHFTKHGSIPMFRLFSVQLTPKDTSYEYLLQHAVLNTYCKKELVETNTSFRFGGTEHYLYSGQNGLLKCTDRETLSFLIGYRKTGDTLSRYTVDTLRYEILLDQEGEPEF